MRARSPRIALAAVMAEGLLGRLAFGMVGFAFPLYALSLGLSLTQIGLLVSLRAIVTLLLKPGAGWLSDHIGLRRVYLLGAFGRVLAAAGLLVADGFPSLAAVRLLLGASAAGRDVASLGVIARDASTRVGTVYSWYASAKHVGGVAGAGAAGLAIVMAEGAFQPLFVVILILGIFPLAAAWIGLREIPGSSAGQSPPPPLRRTIRVRRNGEWVRVIASDSLAWGRSAAFRGSFDRLPVGADRPASIAALIRELAAPASVGVLVATSAYMLHGIFPILATKYAGLNEAQAGLVYSLSAAVFLLGGPVFGWLVDRHGRVVGIAWRSMANVGSSLIYLVSPTLVGFAVARSLDDSGKAAFRPAWASAIADFAAKDPARAGRRLGALDTSQSVGEALGPALAGLLWHSGGVFALFSVRILIAVVAEIVALRTFGELRVLSKEREAGTPRPAAYHLRT